MDTCRHYDIAMDASTKTPYKKFCSAVVKGTGVTGLCNRHTKVGQPSIPRRDYYLAPQSEDVRNSPDARRFE